MRILVGAGKLAEKYLESFQKEEILCYDNDRRKWGKKTKEVEIISLDHFLKLCQMKENEIIVTAKGNSVLYFLRDIIKEDINVLRYTETGELQSVNLSELPPYKLDIASIEKKKLDRYLKSAESFKASGNTVAYEHARRFIRMKEENLLFPEIGGIELTNFCNLACKNCPTPTCKREKGYMTDEVFEEAFKFVAPDREAFFSLHGLGEPLLHKNFFDFLTRLSQIDRPVLISTNGLLLTNDTIHKLLSILKTFSKSMIYISFHTLKSVENWAKCVQMNNELTSGKVLIFGQVLEHNAEEAESWLANLGIVDPKKHKNIRYITSHSFAGNVPGRRNEYCSLEVENRFRNCFYHVGNVTNVAWDGRLKACCLDSELSENIGDIFHLRDVVKQMNSYGLCHSCDPDWTSNFQ